MDKIREEFDRLVGNYKNADTENDFILFQKGYKSRDKEIEVKQHTIDEVAHKCAKLIQEKIDNKEEIRILKNDMDDYTEQAKDSLTSAKIYQDLHIKDEAKIKNLTIGTTVLTNRVITLEAEIKKLRDALEKVFNKIDFLMGDTDPYVGEDWTEEDIEHETPLLWIAQLTSKALRDGK